LKLRFNCPISSRRFVGHPAGRPDHAGDRLGIGPGQDDRTRAAQGEDQDRGDEPLEEVDPDQVGEIVEDHADQDVAAALVPYHDGDEEVVGLLAAAADVLLSQARRDEDILALRIHAGPDPAGVGGGDDLLLVADDGNLPDPAPLQPLHVILEARLAGPALGSELFHADLDGRGQVGGMLLDLGDELALRPPVHDEQDGQDENQQPEYHREELAPQAECPLEPAPHVPALHFKN
jgi:hypothetical protein